MVLNPFKSHLDRLFELPRTAQEYDDMIVELAKHFELTDLDHAAAVVSVAIRRLPPDQSETTLRYLGNHVVKNMANYIADLKAQRLKHESEVRALRDAVATNPNDNEARDKLVKAAADGSTSAFAALASLNVAVPV